MIVPFQDSARTGRHNTNCRPASVQNLKGFSAVNLSLNLSPVGLHFPDRYRLHAANLPHCKPVCQLKDYKTYPLRRCEETETTRSGRSPALRNTRKTACFFYTEGRPPRRPSIISHLLSYGAGRNAAVVVAGVSPAEGIRVDKEAINRPPEIFQTPHSPQLRNDFNVDVVRLPVIHAC
jgi:hypothetical protein